MKSQAQHIAKAAVLLAISTLSAQAHSESEKTALADGATLATAPQEFGMNFDMPMRITLSDETEQM
ncbi:hypothetical protein [Amaricoccus macauensis]|uniref:hypothetical protein n=1 Tax=Amaricoccus macauensis TaxID=57001 RepID=UPI003C7A0F10